MEIGCIKEIIHDEEDEVFYILANKYDQKLGFFIIRMKDQDPSDFKFLTKWKNKLDIGDSNLFVMRNDAGKGKKYKELIVSYKTIYINTYNVTVMDISADLNEATLFRHESFQLWESDVRGLILQNNKDFVTLSKTGVCVLALGSVPKRVITDDKKNERMIHSLESVNFLKVDGDNYILFECAEEDRVISIQQEYSLKSAETGEETQFDKIYSIKIHEITLRELLLFESLYVCKTQSDIVNLVAQQPAPLVFYKSFLEFDCSNMASILSFDSRSMAALLDESNSEFFSDEFPIFYKNKIPK